MDLYNVQESRRCGAFLLHCTGMAEERKEMERLMLKGLWWGGKRWRTSTRWYGW